MSIEEPPVSPVEDGADDHLTAKAYGGVEWGRWLPRAHGGVSVPGTYSTALLKVVVFIVGSFAVMATLAASLLGLPLAVALMAAAIEVLGCAYLIVRLH